MNEQILEKLDKILNLLEKKNIIPSSSEETGELLGALAKAQGAYKKLVPNEDSPAGKFANLEAILFAVKEALSTNGLAFIQKIELLDEGSGAAMLYTILGHSSGQWTSSKARVFSGKTDRATGNTYEIHKRLHALMLLGIAPTSNDPVAFDDNGIEQDEERLIERIVNPKSERVLDHNAVISKDQYNQLIIEIGNYSEIAENIMDTYKIATLADLPAEIFQDALAKMRKIKKTIAEYERSRTKN